MIELKYAVVAITDDGCTSIFRDGRCWGAQPHDTHHYHVIAHRCGYGDDVMRYAVEHEVAHHIVCEALLDRPSPVLWALAHNEPVDPGEAAFEEMAAMTLQRWVRANERPIVASVDWDGIKQRFLEVLP